MAQTTYRVSMDEETMAVAAESRLAASKVTIVLAETGSWTVVTIGGELDIATAPQLEQRLEHIFKAPGAPSVALELSRLRFCDSSGLGLLVRLWKRVRQADGRLVLIRPPGHLITLLSRTGLDRLFTRADTFPDEERP